MTKKKEEHKIIAINPGWRCLGIAVFDGYQLEEWRLKSLPVKGAKRKQEKAMDILAGFIERYDPNLLAIKKLHPSRSSANLKHLTADITTFCQKQGMTVFFHSIKEMENAFSANRISKKELARLVTHEYPELASEMKREERNRNPYFVRLFEAVALGHVCLREINNKH